MRKVLLDANLIVLLIVGNVGREQIAEHKRLSAYTAADWDLLLDLLGGYDQIVLTPNILTEASNLVRSGGKRAQDAFADIFSMLVSDAAEIFIPSREAVQHADFLPLGLTDAGCLSALDPDMTLLTADLGLFVAAIRGGGAAQNFNHFRDPG